MLFQVSSVSPCARIITCSMCLFAVTLATKIPRASYTEPNNWYDNQQIMSALKNEMTSVLGTEFRFNANLTGPAFYHLRNGVEQQDYAKVRKHAGYNSNSKVRFVWVTVQDTDGGPHIEDAVSNTGLENGHPKDGSFNEFGLDWQDASAGGRNQLKFMFIYAQNAGPAPQARAAHRQALKPAAVASPSPTPSVGSVGRRSTGSSAGSAGSGHSTIAPLPQIKVPKGNSGAWGESRETPVADLYDPKTLRIKSSK